MIDNYYVENEHFVEIAGKFYCTKKDCTDCRHQDKCKNAPEKVETDMVLPIRSVIQITKHNRPHKPNTTEQDNQFIEDQKTYLNGSYKGKHLTYSDTRIFKEIIDIKDTPYKDREIDHIVFQVEDSQPKYYCIRQLCNGCKHQDNCNHKLRVVKDQDRIVVFDLAAQEPRSFLLTTRLTNNLEKVWEKVFENDTIREIGTPYIQLETMFRMLNIDTQSDIYYLWVNRNFFYDKSPLYKLRSLANRYYVSLNTPDNQKHLKELDTHFNTLLQSYREFEAEVTR